jgi:molybdopterin-synthase adenylyltransferase
MRYRRQQAFVEIGAVGQERLAAARVAICGIGALGSMVSERLCRMGVGYIRLIDRDWVEFDNLPRQALFTNQDAMDIRPKAIAACERLHAINPECSLEPIVEDVSYANALERLRGVDCIVDGTDNFETRYLINDVSLKLGVPWVHGGIVGASGQCMAFVPGKTACFRCLLPDPPPIDQMQTCDSAGVLGPAVGVIASWQALEACKILVGSDKAGDGCLRVFEMWEGTMRSIRVHRNVGQEHLQCKACGKGDYEFLNGEIGSQARVLCGRGAVQIQSFGRDRIELRALATRLRADCEVFESPFLVRFRFADYVVSVFEDGRAVVQGTENPEEARKIYARWIGG